MEIGRILDWALDVARGMKYLHHEAPVTSKKTPHTPQNAPVANK